MNAQRSLQGNILIVDDVPDNLELLSRILTKRGCEVRSVARGAMAVEIAQTGWADLILLDINMPEMDGFQVCQKLKADPRTSSVPVIFLSASDRVLYKINAFALGGVDYITKPFQIKEVVARVKTHLQLRNLHKTLAEEVETRTAELTKALNKANAANHAKSLFFSQMTHELRTPMNAILGFTQIMQRDKSLNPEQYEQLRIINQSGEHLLALINDVLEVSKIEAGRLVLEKNNFNLNWMLKNIEDMLRLKAQSKNLTFCIERSPHTPQYIKTDEQKLRQVLLNLLANAVKFTNKGQISLQIGYNRSKPYQLNFEVKDTGYGIAPEELNNLFIPFVQTQTGRQSQSGTGLGLSICQEYIKLMGGELKVKSQVQRGSTFSFDIPIEIGEPVVYPSNSGRVIGLQGDRATPKILVAEDRWENRQFLVRLLDTIGFAVREAVDGQEAIAIWQEWCPDVVLMDLQMPVMDGYEATQHIKRLDSEAVIIAITASKFKEQKQFILSSGCSDLLNIPFQEEDLWAKIAKQVNVKYIYEQSPPTSCIDSKILHYDLDVSQLSVMPPSWIEQLNYYATAANAKEIYTLLEQVPESYSELVDALSLLVDDFCFEQIINLTTLASKS